MAQEPVTTAAYSSCCCTRLHRCYVTFDLHARCFWGHGSISWSGGCWFTAASGPISIWLEKIKKRTGIKKKTWRPRFALETTVFRLQKWADTLTVVVLFLFSGDSVSRQARGLKPSWIGGNETMAKCFDMCCTRCVWNIVFVPLGNFIEHTLLVIKFKLK